MKVHDPRYIIAGMIFMGIGLIGMLFQQDFVLEFIHIITQAMGGVN